MDKQIKSTRKLAIDDIYRIGTPDAAVKLVPFLWHKDEDFAIYVAWHLGVLLKNPEVEEKLSKYPLKPEQTPIDELTYIWRPFENNSDSALFAITSRLAYLIKESSAINIPRPILYVDRRIIIPICSIEALEKIKNINLKKQMTSLDRTIKFASLDAHPDLKQNLLNRLLNYRTPTRNDWIKLYTKDINYNFKKSWHYYTVLGISIILSLISVSELFIIIFRDPINIINMVINYFFCFLILNFWLVLWQGIEETLENQFFIAFGLLGIMKFVKELKNLWKTKNVWVGIKILYHGANAGEKVYWFAVVLGILLFSFIVDVEPELAEKGFIILGIMVVTKIVIVLEIWAMAGEIAETIINWYFGIIILPLIVSVVLWVLSTISSLDIWIVAVGVKIVMAGIGLGAWYRAKDKMDWTRYLAIFAFPFFCTFPIVLGYSSYAFYDWFGLTWQQITIIWIAILGVCTVLWQRGQKLDYEARNPFKGILDYVKDDNDVF